MDFTVFLPVHVHRYHDMDSVLDFLVLESLYKVSVRTQWQEGDRFRSLIDGKFWYGTIKEKRAFRSVVCVRVRYCNWSMCVSACCACIQQD